MTPRWKRKRRDIDQYEHNGQDRLNNPPSGLVSPDTDPVTTETMQYSCDHHLAPQLVWTGKAFRTTFDVPTTSLHVHERISLFYIIEAVRKVQAAPGNWASTPT